MKPALETIEKEQLEQGAFQVSETLSGFHDSFRSSVVPECGVFTGMYNPQIDDTIRESFDLGQFEITPDIRASVTSTLSDMYYGTEIGDRHSLGLKEISEWKINDDYRLSNVCQHAGYAAEVISTNKENMIAKLKKTGEQIFRADDMPDELYEQLDGKIDRKNDQYVDKVRVKADGSIETVQMKFVGKNADECFQKLMSKRFDKYFEDGKVDKIEIPKEFYDDVRNRIRDEKKSLCEQYAHVCTDSSKSEAASGLKARIEKLDKLTKKVEQSCVTKSEAVFAVEHPKLYTASQINKAGMKSGTQAAALTAITSGVQNYQAYRDGDISAEQAVKNVVKETAVSGVVAYGTEVLTQAVGGSSIPAAVISMGVESYDDVKGFVKGDLSGSELAYNLGENAVTVVGATVGGIIGGTVGSAAGVVGGVVGGMAGSSIGSKLAENAYHSAVEQISENKDAIVQAGAEISENVTQAVSDITDSAVKTAGEIKTAAADKLDSAADKAAEIKDATISKFSSLFGND